MKKEVANGEVLVELDGDGILTVTLNRPEALNSLTPAMLRQLPDVMRDAVRDLEVRVVVLRGAGRGFCAGGDIRGGGFNGGVDPTDEIGMRLREHPNWATQIEPRTERLLQMIEAPKLLHTMGKPTIAMVRGPVAGAGLSFATACDFRIASETTVMTSAFSKIGASGDCGGSYFVTKLVGPSKAREIYFLSDKLDAQECLRIGLVNKVVPDAELERETYALARRLAKGPPIAYHLIKENINAAEWQGMNETLAIESRNMVRSNLTEDAAEARKAFAEKREGVYHGR